MMSQAVSPSTVTQSPEPTPAWALLSSHAPVGLTSVMPITAICLLQGTQGLLASRIPSLPQVAAFPRVLEPRGGRSIGQDKKRTRAVLSPSPPKDSLLLALGSWLPW